MTAVAEPQRRAYDGLPFAGVFGSLGRSTLRFFEVFGSITQLTFATIRAAFSLPFEGKEVVRQLYHLGSQSLGVGLLTALFTGAVMALQFGHGLARFGAANYVGKLISVGFVMELGPVLTALLVGGRVGAGITAEIGSMRVTEQVDAIRALGADPVKKLVLPRVLACVISMPILCILADVVGILGGMFVASAEQGIAMSFYLDQVMTTVDIPEVTHGVIKAGFFGFFYSIIGCWMGLQTTGGTQGVGRYTTQTVVLTSITILVGDFILGKALLPFVHP